MKLAFTTLFLAAAELALLANVGNAYSSYSSDASDIAARDVGYDLSGSVFTRSIHPSELSDISTRALVEELEDRLVRRDDTQKKIDAIKSNMPNLSGKRLKKAKEALRKLENKLAKHQTGAPGQDHANTQPPVAPVADSSMQADTQAGV